ncbi:hypothetical protein JYU34_004102 [Plutella xylostella]|uniref:Cuticular protein n=1 Tax=Plutella xylostella TaxID=51655 RepID=A0ABQ7QX51_PLUXY|nr:hypothetical protein JYU34_004102 [Plutella xylostella]
MKNTLLLLLCAFVLVESRTTTSDHEDVVNTLITCKNKKLERSVSIVVKHKGSYVKFTVDSDGKAVFDETFKQAAPVKHSYPPSSGLSGGETTVAKDPYVNAIVIPDDVQKENIVSYFDVNCDNLMKALR